MTSLSPVQLAFKGTATPITLEQLAGEAARSRYELAALQAVLEVESSGHGFDDAGRPKLLPEPHKFYAKLAGSPDKLAAAVAAGVAYPKQGMKPYPVGSDANYARLAIMCRIDETAALESTSWGIGQVMGFNYAACGFARVQDLVQAAMASEIAQLGLMLRYSEHAGLDVALRAKNWRSFAAGYNGPGAVDAYSAKLQAAYARHAGQRAPAAPSVAAPAVRQPAADSDALNNAEWLRIRGGQG